LRDRIDLAFFVLGRAQRRAVVEVRPAIPLAVPAVLLDVPRSRPASTVYRSASAPRRRAAAPGGELREHVKQEERQPHALASALLADEVHAVVPVAAAHQRQAVLAKPQSAIDRADAMLVERADVVRNLRQVVVGFLVVAQGARSQKGDALVQHAGIAGHVT
jgi:hypothetical protein